MLRYTGSYTYLTKIYDVIYIYLVLATYAIWCLWWIHIDSTSPWLQGQDTGILFGPCDPAVPSTGNKNVNFKLYGKVNKGCFKMKKSIILQSPILTYCTCFDSNTYTLGKCAHDKCTLAKCTVIESGLSPFLSIVESILSIVESILSIGESILSIRESILSIGESTLLRVW